MFHAGTVKPPIFMGMFQPLHKHALNRGVGDACERPLPPVAAQAHVTLPNCIPRCHPRDANRCQQAFPSLVVKQSPQVCHGLRNEIT
jgi:hypothetical protein